MPHKKRGSHSINPKKAKVLDIHHFQKLVLENGVEHGKGLLEAISEMNNLLGQCFVKKSVIHEVHGEIITPNSAILIENETRKLFENTREFITLANKFIRKPAENSMSQTPKTT